MRMKNMNRILLLQIPLLFLLFTSFAGCDKHDDDEVAMVMFPPLQIEVPYQPIDLSVIPGSLGELAKRDVSYRIDVIICMGKCNGETIYNYWSGYMSSYDGFFYDKDGNLISDGNINVKETKDWKCVYYQEIGGELL